MQTDERHGTGNQRSSNILLQTVTLLYTISLQSKVRIWTNKTPAFPRGIKGFEISLEALKKTE